MNPPKGMQWFSNTYKKFNDTNESQQHKKKLEQCSFEPRIKEVSQVSPVLISLTLFGIMERSLEELRVRIFWHVSVRVPQLNELLFVNQKKKKINT